MYNYIYAERSWLRDLSACSASLCCMWLSMPFLDSYWVRVVVHRHEIIWTLSVTVKPQVAIGCDLAPGGFLYSKMVGVLVMSVRV